MLQRLENEDEPVPDDEEWDDVDSDDESTEDELSDRLADVDLNNADAVWERLTDAEKQEFRSIVYNGEIEKIVQQAEPWWKLKIEIKLIRDVEDEDEAIRGVLKKCPKIPSNIKEFKMISTKTPAACIIYNIANVIGAYTYIYRFYNGDHKSYELEATENMITISANLMSNANFDSISSVADSIMMNCHNASLFSDQHTRNVILEDLKEIFDGPGDDTHRFSFILSSLSDVIILFKMAKLKMKEKNSGESPSASSESSKKKFSTDFPSADTKRSFPLLENQTRFTGCLKKLEFYLAFVKHRLNLIEWPIDWDII